MPHCLPPLKENFKTSIFTTSNSYLKILIGVFTFAYIVKGPVSGYTISFSLALVFISLPKVKELIVSEKSI